MTIMTRPDTPLVPGMGGNNPIKLGSVLYEAGDLGVCGGLHSQGLKGLCSMNKPLDFKSLNRARLGALGMNTTKDTASCLPPSLPSPPPLSSHPPPYPPFLSSSLPFLAGTFQSHCLCGWKSTH